MMRIKATIREEMWVDNITQRALTDGAAADEVVSPFFADISVAGRWTQSKPNLLHARRCRGEEGGRLEKLVVHVGTRKRTTTHVSE
jgi:hypothetical protein